MKHSHIITILEFGLLILGTIFFISAIFRKFFSLSSVRLQVKNSITHGFNKTILIPNTSHRSMQFWENIFADSIISLDVWPSRSQDPNPPDVYLWGTENYAVYREHPRTDLRAVLTTFLQFTASEQLIAVLRDKIRTIQTSIDTNGHHFQKFIVTFQTPWVGVLTK